MQTSRTLLNHFSPTHYNLTLDILRQERAFRGTVVVHGTVRIDGSIWLHANSLTVARCSVEGRTVPHRFHGADELEVDVNAKTGDEIILTIEFEGEITDQMHGMYPCYFDHDGVKKELIATQFESHHAREVFPCIDEPAAKATFDVVLVTEPDVTVLGNMPVASQTSTDGRMKTAFERTPIMSSYLLAWVYGELQRTHATSKSGVEVGVWSTVAQPSSSLSFALDIATRTIDFFDDYFGIPYPLPKCDHVALPDFSSGAMENWGLITYREVALLAEPGTTSVSSKHRIAAVIAHELSHQWFGNLVTMKWWNNLWLNESFANLMEYIAIDALEPSWNVWFDFAAYETVASLRRDATDGVQAVQVDVHHPDEISTLFDPAIVYAKGSRLLRMLEQHVGAAAFRRGLQSYFATYAYKNTVETDLWECLSEASGQDIASLMTPWITQPGYPVLTVTNTGVEQSQFFIGEHTNTNRLWPIPLDSNDPTLPALLQEPAETLPVRLDTRFNVNDSAHFITHYPEATVEAIIKDIQAGALQPVARLQFLHEQTLLARGRKISSAQLIPTINAYKNEQSKSVWDIIALALGELRKFVESDEASEQKLRQLSQSLARPVYERLGWDAQPGEPESDTKLRATALGLMTYGQDQAVIDRCLKLSAEDPSQLDPELRPLILGAAIKHAPDNTLFERLLSLYSSTNSSELQQDIAASVTATKDAGNIALLLERLKNPDETRSQDVARWFVYLMRNRYGRDMAWSWLQTNWDWIESTFGGDKSYDDFPRYAAGAIVTKQAQEEYVRFFTPLRSQTALTRVIDMGQNEIAARIDIIDSDQAAVRSTLINLN